MTPYLHHNCPICTRDTPKEYIEKHHLNPKKRNGPTILVCCSCGDQLHLLFTRKQLEKKYNTLEKILADERVQKWREWISKKPNNFSVCFKTKKRKLR